MQLVSGGGLSAGLGIGIVRRFNLGWLFAF